MVKRPQEKALSSVAPLQRNTCLAYKRGLEGWGAAFVEPGVTHWRQEDIGVSQCCKIRCVRQKLMCSEVLGIQSPIEGTSTPQAGASCALAELWYAEDACCWILEICSAKVSILQPTRLREDPLC